MTINFIAGKFSEGRASHRLRGKHIAEKLKEKGYDTYYGSKMGMIKNGDITVFLKNSSPEQIIAAKKQHSITVYDLCDNKFDEDESLIPCCEQADYITCNSNVMKQEIETRFRKKKKIFTVIPDPYERPELPINFTPKNPIKLLWFGSGSSLGYVPWTEIWKKLESFIKNYELHIISSKATRFKDKTARRILKNEEEYNGINLNKISFYEWNWELQGKLMSEADIILMPLDISHYRTKTKSSNRIVDSLASGKFVITSNLDSYNEFRDFIWTEDFIEGIKWALNNPSIVNKMVYEGQTYSKQYYSIEAVSELWLKFFKVIHNEFK